jgi:hypothetical protein
VRQIEIKAMARRAEVRDRRNILGDPMPAAWQREQRWLPGMITDARFLQYLQIVLMPNLLVLVVRRSVKDNRRIRPRHYARVCSW